MWGRWWRLRLALLVNGNNVLGNVVMIQTLRDLFIAKPQENEAQKTQKVRQAGVVLLLEVARSDFSEDPSERKHIETLLKSQYDLSDGDLRELISISDQGDTASIHPFTSLLNEHYQYDERVELLRQMWSVAYADGTLDKYEDHLIRKVADLLYVRHSDFIKTKLNEATKVSE